MFSQDFVTFTLLCMYKPNRRKYQITEQAQARLFYTCSLIFILQACLIWAILVEFSDNEFISFVKGIDGFNLFLSKFVVTLAMHLDVSGIFQDSIRAIKFMTNHPDKFDMINTCLMIGFIQLFACAAFQVINVQILFSRTTVYFTIVCHITVSLLVQMPKFYYGTVKDNPNIPSNSIFQEENAFKITRRSKDIEFGERPFFNQLSRLTYKTFTLVYASVAYYFLPYIYLIWQQFYVVSYCNEQRKNQQV